MAWLAISVYHRDFGWHNTGQFSALLWPQKLMVGRRVKGRTSPQIMHVSLSDPCTKLWHYTKYSTYPLTSPPPHLTGLLVVSSTVILHASPTDTGWAVYTTPLLLYFTLLATEHPSESFTCVPCFESLNGAGRGVRSARRRGTECCVAITRHGCTVQYATRDFRSSLNHGAVTRLHSYVILVRLDS